MRLIEIVTADIAKDKLLLEERLENLINSDLDIEEKLNSIKDTLKQIVLIESMFIKWQNYMAAFKSNIPEEKQ